MNEQSEKNYFQLCKNEISLIREQSQNGAKKPSLLLHVCCAPCASAVIEQLVEYFTITLIFYNPNIYPQAEYERRRDELVRFIRESVQDAIPVTEIAYNPQEFYKAAAGLENQKERGERCFACYKLRLKKTAEYAAANKFEYFTTALSISPHKDAQKINELGQKIAASFAQISDTKKPLKFLHADFKKQNGYKRSLEISAQYSLYRQTYCGCEFSIKLNKSAS